MLTTLRIKVIPNARKNQIVGWQEDVLKIRLRAIPEKGKANEELIEYLADLLEIPKSAIEIVSGQSSRLKTVLIYGVTKEHLKTRLIQILIFEP